MAKRAEQSLAHRARLRAAPQPVMFVTAGAFGCGNGRGSGRGFMECIGHGLGIGHGYGLWYGLGRGHGTWIGRGWA